MNNYCKCLTCRVDIPIETAYYSIGWYCFTCFNKLLEEDNYYKYLT